MINICKCRDRARGPVLVCTMDACEYIQMFASLPDFELSVEAQ